MAERKRVLRAWGRKYVVRVEVREVKARKSGKGKVKRGR